jgi:hypothetical protein
MSKPAKFPIFQKPPTQPAPVPQPAPAQATHPGQYSRGEFQGVSLYIATPAFACRLTNGYVQSILQLQLRCSELGIPVCFDILGNESLVQRARNVLCERFRQSSSTYLLFIDADIRFNPETVFRLLKFNKPIVGSCYPKKFLNWGLIEAKMKAKDPEPMHQYGLDFNINIVGKQAEVIEGFVKCLDIATGFLLITRDAIEKVAKAFPELRCKNDIQNENMKLDFYDAVFDCAIDEESKRYLSEDYAFCRRAQKVGLEIWVDVVSPLSHTGSMILQGDFRKRLASLRV